MESTAVHIPFNLPQSTEVMAWTKKRDAIIKTWIRRGMYDRRKTWAAAAKAEDKITMVFATQHTNDTNTQPTHPPQLSCVCVYAPSGRQHAVTLRASHLVVFVVVYIYIYIYIIYASPM